MGKCLEVNLGVTLKVASGNLHGDLPSEIEGKKGMKIGGMKIGSMSGRENSSAMEKDRVKLTGQYQVLRSVNVVIRETRNLNDCIG